MRHLLSEANCRAIRARNEIVTLEQIANVGNSVPVHNGSNARFGFSPISGAISVEAIALL